MARPRAQIDFSRLATVFAEEGPGASVEHLARAAGLAKPTLYARVGGRDELFRATIDAELERLLERLRDAADRSRYAGPRERIAALASELADTPRAGARLLLVTAPSAAAHRRLRTAIVEGIRRDGGLAAEDAELIAIALLGALSQTLIAEAPLPVGELAGLLTPEGAGDETPPAPTWGA